MLVSSTTLKERALQRCKIPRGRFGAVLESSCSANKHMCSTGSPLSLPLPSSLHPLHAKKPALVKANSLPSCKIQWTIPRFHYPSKTSSNWLTLFLNHFISLGFGIPHLPVFSFPLCLRFLCLWGFSFWPLNVGGLQGSHFSPLVFGNYILYLRNLVLSL